MGWLDKIKSGIRTRSKRELPDGLWTKCDACGSVIYQRDLEEACWTCPQCHHHFRVGSDTYLRVVTNDGYFREIHAGMTAGDPLKFKDKKTYRERVKDYRKATGINEAIRTGEAVIGHHRVALGIMDFRFHGGSMGSVVGEKVARLVDFAMREHLPLVIVSTSGGARMQEGALSLMQMAKTSAKLYQLSQTGLPYISILTDPTTGGTSASFAMLGDINIGEPGAMIGFAGPGIIKETMGRDELPEGFQRAESVMEHGFLDMIVHRKEMRKTLIALLDFLTYHLRKDFDDDGRAQVKRIVPQRRLDL
ncbi:MAG: acetyl-CoA carboxylase carboxyltransferase subunit beta [Candidatus Latescibacteria bacterium]|nr:acetyl-CoA carboxylase carboxyltransferase subunit beta [Candidatus Latescibacterota bacterium]